MQRSYLIKLVASVVTSVACIGILATWAANPNGDPTASNWRPGHQPAQGGWTKLPASPLSARHDSVGAFVGSEFVIAGGSSEPPCPAGASCAVPRLPTLRDGAAFNPGSGNWHAIADAPRPVAGFNIAIVGVTIYVLTATDGRPDNPVGFLSYDVGTDVWTTLPDPPDLDATLVAAGDAVVAIASTDERTRAIDAAFDPHTRTWLVLPDDPLGPSFGRDAVWVGDRLVLTASDLALSSNSHQPAVNRFATLDRALRTWSAPFRDSDVVGSGPLAASGRVVWPDYGASDAGGDWDRPYPLGGILDPATGRWQPVPQNAPDTVGLMPCELVVDGRVCVAGHLLNPVTLEWTRLAKLPGGQRSGSAMVAGPDTVWVWGGSPDDGSSQPSISATGFVFRL